MDKKTIIGLVLMVAVFVGFSFYESKKAAKYEEWKKGQVEMQKALAEKQAEERAAVAQLSQEERAVRDSLERARIENADLYKYGSALKAAHDAKGEIFSVSNEVFKVDFSTKGGKIQNVTLLDPRYTRFAEGERTEQVQLMQPEHEVFGVELKSVNDNSTFLSDDFTFDVEQSKEESAEVVRMTLNLSDNSALTYVYRIYNTGNPSRDYLIDFSIEERNIAQHIASSEELMLTWRSRSNKNERSYQNENMATNIIYFEEGDMEEFDTSGKREKLENVSWVAYKQQYFTSAFISPEELTLDAEFKNSTKEGKDFMKEFSSTISLPLSKDKRAYKIGRAHV